MKSSINKPAASEQTPVFPQTLHRVRTKVTEAAPNSKNARRDKIFSKSRDTREDRGQRQMKTGKNPQTFTHGR